MTTTVEGTFSFFRYKAIFKVGTIGDPDIPGGTRKEYECDDYCVYYNDECHDISFYLSQKTIDTIIMMATNKLSGGF